MKLNLIKYSLYFLFIIIMGCSESITDEPFTNQFPETKLFLYPDGEISQQKSRLQVHWWGDDKDGLVIGYLIRWIGIDDNWSFTTSNDSTFSLPIGTVDTSFTFQVASIDNAGNGIYDQNVFLNGENIMSEPFIDENNNGQYDSGELFFDFGAIDESPAEQNFPIKNSAPKIAWNDLSVLPEKSFPVITLGWDAFDLDGDETITEIHIALNDTAEFISVKGSVRIVSLIIDDINAETPLMNVYESADKNKIVSEKLNNLKLNDNNKLFIRAQDISGSKSSFVVLPDSGKDWFVAKPQGDLLIVDDYESGLDAEQFYNERFDNIAPDGYDVFNIENTELPYESITFPNTIKLFKYIYWYSDSNPSIELTNLVTKEYLQNGGKIAYSMTFQDSSSTFEFSAQIVQSFLPIEQFDDEKPLSFLFPGGSVIGSEEFSNYPTLETSSTIGFVRTFQVSEITSKKVYDLTSNQLNGSIALLNNTKNLFYIGLPLNQCDGRNNVSDLLSEIFVNEFGL